MPGYRRDDRSTSVLRTPACVRLRAWRVPVHGAAVRAAHVPLALVRRNAEGRARVAVLVGGREGVHGTAVAADADTRPPATAGARQEAGHHVAGERVRAVRVHDVHHNRDHRPVPSVPVDAVGRGVGRRVSAQAARPPRRPYQPRVRRTAVAARATRRPRLATVQSFHHRCVRRLRVRDLLRVEHVKVRVLCENVLPLTDH